MKGVLAFFHYCLFLAVPVFFYIAFDGKLWPETGLFVGMDNPFVIPTIVVMIVLWTALIVFPLRLAFDAGYREACFKTLAGLHERDEREATIVGSAARHTFLLSLALIVGLTILSLFDISFNAHGLQQLGLDKRRTDLIVLPWDSHGNTVFNIMPLTKTGVLVFLLIVQLAAFRYFSWRAARHAK